jgi:hypothetical protein
VKAFLILVGMEIYRMSLNVDGDEWALSRIFEKKHQWYKELE